MTPRLSRSVLDRAAHRRNDSAWLAAAWQRSRVLLVDPETASAPVEGDPPRLRFVTPAEAPAGDRLYLGGEETPYFAVATTVVDGGGLREVGAELSEFDAGVLTEAVALVRWHVDHRFHHLDGTPTRPTAGGWERRTTDDVVWPRTDPAIMVMITDGADRCLLANGVGWPSDRYSCVAGFVEPGESAEAAAHREVGEEVGVTLTDLTYVASQPWPFPRSLMLAFEGVADPTARIVVQDDEIAHARWFHRDELAAALRGEAGPLRVPPSISISRFLMERWLAKVEPRLVG
ncbi:NAD+ diphosphatase [Stackebrandtia endophytica]|uniref:NAD(+) diphosphatase n=1 Tax=Stackebrandtia endophytica TaxID=1496996 RepID=A0A543ASW3_9ACTN|nr:NAD(+) diphosphatase [Stackebrandtia endophytica]TQL75682.1 NAD+ diphosphatase [Stackebrandtia endophytica]